MTRDELLYKICPIDMTFVCCNPGNKSCCKDCECVMSEWLDAYDKHVIAEYEAKHGNLADTIREIHDCVAKEIYRKGIDDFLNAIAEHFNKNLDDYIERGATYSDIKQIAEQLKEQEK